MATACARFEFHRSYRMAECVLHAAVLTVLLTSLCVRQAVVATGSVEGKADSKQMGLTKGEKRRLALQRVKASEETAASGIKVAAASSHLGPYSAFQ